MPYGRTYSSTCRSGGPAIAVNTMRAPRVQAKLRIGAANDACERQADRVADRVMRMPEPNVQRKCAGCEEEESRVRRKESGAATGAATAPQSVHEAIASSGRPLDPSIRSYMEPRFGHDFGDVRIHTGSRAAESARSVNAFAYTVGRDVVFGDGAYRPETESGRRLIAHELTHVVQQNGGAGVVQRETKEKTPCAVHAYDASDPLDTAIVPDDKSGIGVTSVDDMVTKVNAYVNDDKNGCSCVSRLEINGHGTDGYQSVGNGNKYVNDDKAIVHDSTEEHLNKLKNIKLCDRGLVMLLGCHVGRGNGKVLLSKLANVLPGKLVGGAQHFTSPKGLGKAKVLGAGDTLNAAGKIETDKTDPFLTSPYVRWHIVIGGKEYVIPGNETTTDEAKSKLKAADKIKVKTPDGEQIIK